MKTKDTILLEAAYEQTSKGLDDSMTNSEESNTEMSSINPDFTALVSELEKANFGPGIFSILNKIKKEIQYKDLIEYLNSIEDWTSKDRLIEILFRSFGESNLV
jgi:hypothetical protein